MRSPSARRRGPRQSRPNDCSLPGDLHDQVAHAIGVRHPGRRRQEGADRRFIASRPEEAATALAAIEATSRETLAGLRLAVGALRRADAGSETSGTVFGAQLRLADIPKLTESTRKAGVDVKVHWQGEQRALSAEVDACAFRIVQEALTNVVRHAGQRRASS